MRIAGFKKQSLIDYPGNISSVVFTQGCNFRCPYCHNPELVLPEKFKKPYTEAIIFDYLKRYQKMIDAVCITGGEPTLHKDLLNFIENLKKMRFKVKLDTNGTNPEMLKKLIDKNLVDLFAMDIKHVLEFKKYNQTVGNVINSSIFVKVLESIELIQSSNVKHIFRTTIAKNLHKRKDIQDLKNQFNPYYTIQNINTDIVLDKKISFQSFTKNEFNAMQQAKQNVKN